MKRLLCRLILLSVLFTLLGFFFAQFGCKVESVPREVRVANRVESTTKIDEAYILTLPDTANWRLSATHISEVEKSLRAIDAAIVDVSTDLAKGTVPTLYRAELHKARAMLFEVRALLLMQIHNLSNPDMFPIEVLENGPTTSF